MDCSPFVPRSERFRFVVALQDIPVPETYNVGCAKAAMRVMHGWQYPVNQM
jgi:hypothetical protein